MSLKTLESEILAEAKVVTKNKALKMKDILEWSTGEIKSIPGEKIYKLPSLGINIAIKE